jgi:hypothetical protein
MSPASSAARVSVLPRALPSMPCASATAWAMGPYQRSFCFAVRPQHNDEWSTPLLS